jgi:ParB/RepB/Spo0J family partition protein
MIRKANPSARTQKAARKPAAARNGHCPTAAAATPAQAQAAEYSAVMIGVNLIEGDPQNPRQDWDEEELKSLADSLATTRLLHPVRVRPTGSGRYRLIEGERRWRAARLAGWELIPAFVCDASPEAALQMMVTENLHRKDLNPIEKARSIALLIKPKSEGGAGLKQPEVGKMFGKSSSWAGNLLRLLQLPEDWQHLIASRKVSEGVARAVILYADRPDVLSAVALDIETNPDDWRGRENVNEKVDWIAARFDSLAPTTDEPAADEPAVSPEPDESAPCTLRVLRSCPVNHDPAGDDPGDEKGIVSRIVRLIGQLKTVEEVDDVMRSLNARREELE